MTIVFVKCDICGRRMGVGTTRTGMDSVGSTKKLREEDYFCSRKNCGVTQ